MNAMDIDKNKRTKPKKNTEQFRYGDQYDEYDHGKGMKKERKRNKRRDTKSFLKQYGEDIEFTDNFEDF